MHERKIEYHQPELPCQREAIDELRAAVAAPYDAALQRLERLSRSVNHSEREAIATVRYATGFGELTFDEIHDRTRNLAAHIMHKSYGIENYDDVEDSLQFGYWKLWEKLEREPTFLEERNHGYVARSVCFRAKRERYRHIRHNQRNALFPEEIYPKGFTPHSWESREADRRIDLENAITATAQIYGDSSLYLSTMYYVLTNLTYLDMQDIGIKRNSLISAAKSVRVMLKAHLQ